ncbi:unnamed protein product [Cercospora beticola]|nr:unnamed protein product [Cercospora beticola]
MPGDRAQSEQGRAAANVDANQLTIPHLSSCALHTASVVHFIYNHIFTSLTLASSCLYVSHSIVVLLILHNFYNQPSPHQPPFLRYRSRPPLDEGCAVRKQQSDPRQRHDTKHIYSANYADDSPRFLVLLDRTIARRMCCHYTISFLC